MNSKEALDRIPDLRYVINAADAGPWKLLLADGPHGRVRVIRSRHGWLWNPHTGDINDGADAAFIVAAREAFGPTLDLVEELLTGRESE